MLTGFCPFVPCFLFSDIHTAAILLMLLCELLKMRKKRKKLKKDLTSDRTFTIIRNRERSVTLLHLPIVRNRRQIKK